MATFSRIFCIFAETKNLLAMKVKYYLLILVSLVIGCVFILFCSFKKRDNTRIPQNRFINQFNAAKCQNINVIYDKETGVEYLIINNSHSGIAITPLYNADGSFKLHK